MLLTVLSYAPKSVQRLFNREEGATLVEYGLLVALIAIACVTAIGLVGTSVDSLFSSVESNLGQTTP